MMPGTNPGSRPTSVSRPKGPWAHLNKKTRSYANKLVAEERARLNAEAGLKNAKDQLKKLYLTEILAT